MDAEYLELISLNIWHIIATIANLLILTLILKKFLFKPVQNVLAQRKQEVETLYTGAEEAKTQAENDKKLYSEKLMGAKEEADNIIKTASARAEKLGDEIVSEAKAKAADSATKAEADIECEKKKALNELKNEISDISVQIAENVVEREINDEDHRELIDSFIDKL
jgi:F-type H+-transporting ATPase subunit b